MPLPLTLGLANNAGKSLALGEARQLRVDIVGQLGARNLVTHALTLPPGVYEELVVLARQSHSSG
jgi:hypothetical protein